MLWRQRGKHWSPRASPKQCAGWREGTFAATLAAIVSRNFFMTLLSPFCAMVASGTVAGCLPQSTGSLGIGLKVYRNEVAHEQVIQLLKLGFRVEKALLTSHCINAYPSR